MDYLSFEKPIEELEVQLSKALELADDTGVDMAKSIDDIRQKLDEAKKKIYGNLSAWERVQLSRHPQRPYTQAYINAITEGNFIEMHGDRGVKDDKAMIGDINHGAAQLLGYSRSDMINQPLSRFFKGFSRESLLSVIDNGNHSSAGDIRSFETRNTQRSLQLTGKIFRASGEQLAMLRLSDTVEGTVGDGQLISGLRQLFLKGVDAIVFTDRDGTILAAGETFLNLTDFPANSAIKGRSVAEFLGRGTVDLRVLLDNARRAGQLRMYATKIKTDFGTQLPVEISATWLDDQFEPVMALVFRNATNASTVRVDQTATPESNMSNIVELVGSSTLKDIVSETTDVIEKICIETAIELTRNNRVAAAEMLGLSRQSLYVKLRKYGMLSKDDD